MLPLIYSVLFGQENAIRLKYIIIENMRITNPIIKIKIAVIASNKYLFCSFLYYIKSENNTDFIIIKSRYHIDNPLKQ